MMINRIKRFIKRKIKQSRKTKTLVIFTGMLRTYKRTTPSLIKNLINPLDADVLFLGPDIVGGVSHRDNKSKGIDTDKNGAPDLEFLKANFEKRIVGIDFFKYQDRTKGDINDEWSVAGVKIERVFSFFYNIKKAINSIDISKYDVVILTRPDIVMYRPFYLPWDLDDSLYFNIGEGYDEQGNRKLGCAEAFPFVNVEHGIAIGRGEMSFNDQVMFAKPGTVNKLASLYDNLEHYIKDIGVPATPETLILFHMHLMQKVNVSGGDFTSHEIVRDSTPDIRNDKFKNFDYYFK